MARVPSHRFDPKFKTWMNEEIKSTIMSSRMPNIICNPAFKHLICSRSYDTNEYIDKFLEQIIEEGELLEIYDYSYIIIKVNETKYSIKYYDIYSKFCSTCHLCENERVPLLGWNNNIWINFMPSRLVAFKFQRWLNKQFKKLYKLEKQRISENIIKHLSLKG